MAAIMVKSTHLILVLNSTLLRFLAFPSSIQSRCNDKVTAPKVNGIVKHVRMVFTKKYQLATKIISLPKASNSMIVKDFLFCTVVY